MDRSDSKFGVTQIRTLKVNDKNDCTIFTAPIFYLMIYQNSLDFAQQLDREDPIAHLRQEFHIPKDQNGNDWLYFTGNSLGLQPKLTQKYIQQELDDCQIWSRGHFEAQNLGCHTMSF